jgi:hypothetical protein
MRPAALLLDRRRQRTACLLAYRHRCPPQATPDASYSSLLHRRHRHLVRCIRLRPRPLPLSPPCPLHPPPPPIRISGGGSGFCSDTIVTIPFVNENNNERKMYYLNNQRRTDRWVRVRVNPNPNPQRYNRL